MPCPFRPRRDHPDIEVGDPPDDPDFPPQLLVPGEKPVKPPTIKEPAGAGAGVGTFPQPWMVTPTDMTKDVEDVISEPVYEDPIDPFEPDPEVQKPVAEPAIAEQPQQLDKADRTSKKKKGKKKVTYEKAAEETVKQLVTEAVNIDRQGSVGVPTQHVGGLGGGDRNLITVAENVAAEAFSAPPEVPFSEPSAISEANQKYTKFSGKVLPKKWQSQSGNAARGGRAFGQLRRFYY